MSSKEDPLASVEAGREDLGQERPKSPEAVATTERNDGSPMQARKWHLLVGILLVGAVLVAVAVPVSRRDSSPTPIVTPIDPPTTPSPPTVPPPTVPAPPTPTVPAPPTPTVPAPPTPTVPDPPAPSPGVVSNFTQCEDIEDLYVTVDGPFAANLSLFGEGVACGYRDVEQLRSDLENVAWFFLSNVVRRNTGEAGFEQVGLGFPQTREFIQEDMDLDFTDPPPESTPTAPDGDRQRLDDYGTNNQEAGVEEGDLLVSDGERVYGAYGDTVVMWEARTGEMLTSVKLPTLAEFQSEQGLEKPEQTDSSVYHPYVSQPSIRSLVVHQNRLLVIASGYASVFRNSLTRSTPILSEFMSTHVRVYDTSSMSEEEGTLALVKTLDLNGSFNQVRVIRGKAHIVTTSSVDTYTYLAQPAERYNFGEMSDVEYTEEVRTLAKDRVVNSFVDGLVEELSFGGKSVNLARINLWQRASSGTNLEARVFGEGVLNSLTEVSSLDMLETSDQIVASTAGSFLSSYVNQVYAATNMLIVVAQGWDYSPADWRSAESTYLIGFELDGASSAPHSVGQVPGYVLNTHAIDVLGNTLRIATTIRNSWTVFFDDMPFIDEEVVEPLQFVEPRPSPPIMEDESRTENYIITLDMPGAGSDGEAGVMEELGRLKLGKPNEVFFAVRFFDNVAYAVTFEQIDPLYTLDLSDPRNPVILSELEITGFSSYLHSMNDDNTLLLSIGQEADGEGDILGLALTVFDMTDASLPVVADRHVIERDPNTYSSSDSLWDFKATRYAGGRLILPVDINSYLDRSLDFHGYMVFVVDENGIEEDCRIQHDARGPRSATEDFVRFDVCYYCAWMPRRSMIFGGNLMTTEGHFIQSTDLDTCEKVWDLPIVLSNPDGGCCY